MHGPATAPTASPATTCVSCGGDGPVRVVDEAGASQLCALHAMDVVARAEEGVPVALVLGAEVRRVSR